MTDLNRTNAQLVARCMFSRATGKAEFEDYMKYWPSSEGHKSRMLTMFGRKP